MRTNSLGFATANMPPPQERSVTVAVDEPPAPRRSFMSRSNLLCQNEPILQIPGFNVYTRTIVEADARFGDYSECNPDPDTGVFACGHFHFHHRACWFNDTENPQWKQEFADFCDPNVCSCDAVEKESVGHEALGDVFGRFSVKDWPQQCLDDSRASLVVRALSVFPNCEVKRAQSVVPFVDGNVNHLFRGIGARDL